MEGTVRVAYFCDGTWSDPVTDTNIYRMASAVLYQPGEQDARYDDGVGCDGLPLQRLNGGAFADGLTKKVMDGYTRIAHLYGAGDELFIFGFSRGAYTARSIAPAHAKCRSALRRYGVAGIPRQRGAACAAGIAG
jgi:uncharacterized protein (DUF2235 family)